MSRSNTRNIKTQRSASCAPSVDMYFMISFPALRTHFGPGWLDHDLFVGNFLHCPFTLLSQFSLLRGVTGPELLFMAGQHTAFNLDDPASGSAWKKSPEINTPSHFTQHLAGKMPSSDEERFWSYGYLRSDEVRISPTGSTPICRATTTSTGNGTTKTRAPSTSSQDGRSSSYSRKQIEALI